MSHDMNCPGCGEYHVGFGLCDTCYRQRMVDRAKRDAKITVPWFEIIVAAVLAITGGIILWAM